MVSLVSKIYALPEGEEVRAGQAEFRRDQQNLKIVASDKTIIDYQKFNIDTNERVEFLQPSKNSYVLNRVKDKNISRILGELKSNGKVFLVNPYGIYFGKSAIINTGSFIASTLNIKDSDFLNESFKFGLDPEFKTSKILNEGNISSEENGFIALFSPIIQNHGTILAKAGKVVLASAEKVTLDFSQDGLVQFSVEGDLKKNLIENYGKIVSEGGDLLISLKAAKDAIKMVVNTDGIVAANAIEEVDGVIRLVNTGELKGERVIIDGDKDSKIIVQGKIDGS